MELTYNWDPEPYTGGRNFGHLAYAVDNIYDICKAFIAHGVTINRPPRDGRMAFRDGGKTTSTANSAESAQDPLPAWLPAQLIGPFLAYEIVALLVLHYRLARGSAFPTAARFANALIEWQPTT